MMADKGKLWGTFCNGEIEIQTLTEKDLEASLDILETFFKHESVCIGCEIDLPQNSLPRKELRELCRITAQDGLSIVAKHVPSGKPVGIAFNKIQFLDKSSSEEPFFIDFCNKHVRTPHAKCLMDYMIAIDSEIDVFEMYKTDCLCEIMFLATLPEFGGKGIARTLVKYSVDLARDMKHGIGLEYVHQNLRDKRPTVVTALLTSCYSQKVGKVNGFKVLNTVPHARFSFDGKTFDQRIGPQHKHCEQVALVL